MGNAFTSYGGNLIMSYFSTHLCGVDEQNCGDSSISCALSLAYLSYLNSTNNYGYYGGAMVSMMSSEKGSV